jgi:LPXTG-motif cell wall-anchored protein
VSVILTGWVGLDETMTWLQLLGAALVLGGVVLVSVKRQGYG